MSKLQNKILDHIPTYKKNKRGKRISKKLKIKKKSYLSHRTEFHANNTLGKIDTRDFV